MLLNFVFKLATSYLCCLQGTIFCPGRICFIARSRSSQGGLEPPIGLARLGRCGRVDRRLQGVQDRRDDRPQRHRCIGMCGHPRRHLRRKGADQAHYHGDEDRLQAFEVHVITPFR